MHFLRGVFFNRFKKLVFFHYFDLDYVQFLYNVFLKEDNQGLSGGKTNLHINSLTTLTLIIYIFKLYKNSNFQI